MILIGKIVFFKQFITDFEFKLSLPNIWFYVLQLKANSGFF